jgi:hypothetical protein
MEMKVVTDRYKFSPSEAREFVEAYGKDKKALEGAIANAEERSRLFFMYATWVATWTKDGGILVTRTRRPTQKIKIEVKTFGVTNDHSQNGRLG